MKTILVALLFLVACGKEDKARTNCVLFGDDCHKQEEARNPQQEEINTLKDTLAALQGTVTMINSFTASDFSDCKPTLPPFEQKVCNIAKTAVAEGQLEYFSSLAALSKLFQTQMYGADCSDTTSPGCPVAGSITSDLSNVQSQMGSATSSITSINSQISVIQGSITTLQTSVAAVNTRLNSFNGTSQSIETVVTGINSDITTLKSRVSAIEATVASGKVYKTIQVCRDIPSSGPVFEALLISGDRTELVGYAESGQDSGSTRGLAVIATAGSSGTQYLPTTLNTAACKFKVYDLTSQLKVCWKNDNRSATAAQIDTACNAPSFASPQTTCTCK